MSQFYLMHCQPDPQQLTVWAARHGLLGPQGDVGYALHSLLRAAFGDRAPQPFSYRDARSGLLAYTHVPSVELTELAALAPPDVANALGLDAGPLSAGLSARPFPQHWRRGQVLGFEVRVRPVQRAVDGRERDVFLAAAERASVEVPVQREAVYAHWLSEQLGTLGAARLLDARLTRFQLTDVIRRTQAAGGTGDARKKRLVCGPDVVFDGRLQVEDPVAFAQRVARGLGRHRSFGFGMLLLKPASGLA